MRQRLLHHFLIATAALAALALGSPWAADAGADVAQVTVVSPGGASQTLALDALTGSEDVVARSYALRSSSGDDDLGVTGFSLAKILDVAGADLFGFSYLEAQRPAGGSVLLSRHQALDPGAFPEGPPVVYATAAGTGFLRPSAGTEDLNGGDSFEAPQGVTLVLRKGSPLQVRATASPTRVKAGEKVSFSAVVDRAGSGEQLDYSWYFDDGHSAEGVSTTHGFAKRGSYDVVVGVTTPGNDAGTSAVVTVQVGPPVAGGPDRKGGGTNRTAGAPDHGAASGPAGGTPHLGTGGSVGHAPPDTQPPAALSVRRGTTDRPAHESKPAPPGEEVEGELVSANTTMPPKDEQGQVAARTGNLNGNGGGGSIPTAAAGLLAALGLLGAGALIETGRVGRLLAAMRHKVAPGASA